MSPNLTGGAPIPSCNDCVACGARPQGYPPARAKTARGLDPLLRKPKADLSDKREWEPLELAVGVISTLLRKGTFLFWYDTLSLVPCQ